MWVEIEAIIFRWIRNARESDIILIRNAEN